MMAGVVSLGPLQLLRRKPLRIGNTWDVFLTIFLAGDSLDSRTQLPEDSGSSKFLKIVTLMLNHSFMPF